MAPKITPKDWEEDVKQGHLVLETIKANLNKTYEDNRNRFNVQEQMEDNHKAIQELEQTRRNLRHQLHEMKDQATKYKMTNKRTNKMDKMLRKFELEFDQLRLDVDNGAGLTARVESSGGQGLTYAPATSDKKAKKALEQVDEIMANIDRRVDTLDEASQLLGLKVRNINGEVISQQQLLDDIETGVAVSKKKIQLEAKNAEEETKRNKSVCKLYCIIFLLVALLACLLVNKIL